MGVEREGVVYELFVTNQARRREGRLDQEGQGHQVDARGRRQWPPTWFHLDSAGRAEVRLAQQTLDTIHIARPRGRPKQRPEEVVADRGV